MKQVFENDFCRLTLDQHHILWLNWKHNTSYMTNGCFKDSLLQTFEILDKHNLNKCVFNQEQFLVKPEPECIDWFHKVLVPKFDKTKSLKLAVLLGKNQENTFNLYTRTSRYQFETQEFTSKSDMINWLT